MREKIIVKTQHIHRTLITLSFYGFAIFEFSICSNSVLNKRKDLKFLQKIINSRFFKGYIILKIKHSGYFLTNFLGI